MGKRRPQKRASWLPRADTAAEEVGVIKLNLTASSSFFEKATLRGMARFTGVMFL